jgi:flagellar assembly protein FliH
MKASAKYLFNEDFSGGQKPTISMVEHERRRADAESQAYRKGFTAGEAKAKTEASEHVATVLGVIADSLDRLHRALTGIEARFESEAIEVAVAVAGKLAPELIAREPMAEISALATECFRHLVATPNVEVRVGADIYDAAKHELEQIARDRGFEGRLFVQSDGTMAGGDCRIEWADGGVVRDRDTIQSTIDDVVARYVAARNSATQ